MINIIGLKDYKKYNKNKESKDLIFLNVMYEDQIKNSNPKKITLWWMWAICLLSILIWALSPDREWERRERMSNPILNIFIISTITYNIGKYVEKNSNKIDIP